MKPTHTFYYFCIFILAINSNTVAQTTIWGVGSGDITSTAYAEFVDSFRLTTNSNDLSDTAWTAVAISQDTNTTPGNAYWEHTTTASRGAYGHYTIGTGQGGIGTFQPNDPNSQMNGVALFDSDFMDNGGVQGAFGTGTAPALQSGALISPVIDLSGYTDSALVLKMNTFWRNFRSTCIISMSTDNGTTWTDVDLGAILYTGINWSSEDRVSIPFYSLTDGVANLSQCRIKLTFSGEYYVWIIDDLAIQIAPDYDLAIKRKHPNNNGRTDAAVAVRIGGNRYIPRYQIDTNNMKQWFWGASIANYGAKDMDAMTQSAVLYMKVDYTDPYTNAVTPNVYLDTIQLQGILEANGAIQIDTIKFIKNIGFLCPNHRPSGDYEVTYWLESQGTDADSMNNSISYALSITDQSSPHPNYLSKAGLNVYGQPRAAGPVIPQGVELLDFEYGSMFYLHRAFSGFLKIDSIDFRYYLPNSYTGDTTQTLFINLYKWNDWDNNGRLATGSAQSNPELTRVGINSYLASGLGTTHAAGTYETGTVRTLLDINTGIPLTRRDLEDTSFYLVTIQLNPKRAGSSDTTFNANNSVWIAYDGANYAMNSLYTNGANPLPNVSPTKIVDTSGVGAWDWLGFGADRVPSIGLHVSGDYYGNGTCYTSISTVEEVGEKMRLKVYPNPTTDLLYLEMTAEERTDMTYIITDAQGRIINVSIAAAKNGTVNLDVSKLSSGVYYITARGTDGREVTQSFVKQ